MMDTYYRLHAEEGNRATQGCWAEFFGSRLLLCSSRADDAQFVSGAGPGRGAGLAHSALQRSVACAGLVFPFLDDFPHEGAGVLALQED